MYKIDLCISRDYYVYYAMITEETRAVFKTPLNNWSWSIIMRLARCNLLHLALSWSRVFMVINKIDVPNFLNTLRISFRSICFILFLDNLIPFEILSFFLANSIVHTRDEFSISFMIRFERTIAEFIRYFLHIHLHPAVTSFKA